MHKELVPVAIFQLIRQLPVLVPAVAAVRKWDRGECEELKKGKKSKWERCMVLRRLEWLY